MELVLEDGRSFRGRPFGALRDVGGEVVFNTGMTGYVEALTDPSYRGQILVFTYPLIGNYGVPGEGFESGQIQVQGVVLSRASTGPSHHALQKTASEWLRASGVPGLEGVDTRALTRHLREHGTLGGRLVEKAAEAKDLARVDMRRVAERAAHPQTVRYPGSGPQLLVIDTGAKEGILTSLRARGAGLIRAPFYSDWEVHLPEVDGVVLTNGPGDPADLTPLVLRLRRLLDKGLPILGVCLGHQLLALAAGATTSKLKYGHRSQNQPVLCRTRQRAYVTSQNHGYAVEEASLPADWEPWFVNLHDGTNEGIRHSYRPFWSVQFHPEGAPGPRDTAFIFDDYLRMVVALGKR